MLMIGSRGEDCILIELFVLISTRASAYAAAQIPGRPLLRKEETPREKAVVPSSPDGKQCSQCFDTTPQPPAADQR